MNRRALLKLLATGALGHVLDVDKLLWVPGAKTIFLPSLTKLTESQIIAIELERILPKIKVLFERDDTFFEALSKKSVVSERTIRIPLKFTDE